MAKTSAAQAKPQTAEEKLAAKKKRAEAETAAVTRLEQAIKDKPNLEAEVAQAENNLMQWAAAGTGYKADLRRKRQSLSDCKQLLGEPVRAQKVAAGGSPASGAAGAQDAPASPEQAPAKEGDDD